MLCYAAGLGQKGREAIGIIGLPLITAETAPPHERPAHRSAALWPLSSGKYPATREHQTAASVLLPEERECNHIPDGGRVAEEHGEPVKPDAEPARGGHALLERL
jgi:hypothetical protein